MAKTKIEKAIACFQPPDKPKKKVKLCKEWFVTWRYPHWNSTRHAVLATGQWGHKATSLCGQASLWFFEGLAYGHRTCKTCKRLAKKLGVRTI
jgi:hypothetical protein